MQRVEHKPLPHYLQTSLVRDSVRDFRRVTGFAAQLFPPAASGSTFSFGSRDLLFCRLARRLGGCPDCIKTQRKLFQGPQTKQGGRSVCCYAGIVNVAVPVLVQGHVVGALVGGKVRLRKEGSNPFSGVCRALGLSRLNSIATKRLRTSYNQVPVFSRTQLSSTIRLLKDLARLIGASVAPTKTAFLAGEPPLVAKSREIIRHHDGGRLTTQAVARSLRLNPSYFCRAFRRATGLTFHSYLARLRVEAALKALSDSNQSITSAGFSAGFQSSSDFNRVFKATLGMTPTEFRRRKPAV